MQMGGGDALRPRGPDLAQERAFFSYSLLLQSKIKSSGLLASNSQPEGWSKSVLFNLAFLVVWVGWGGCVETSKLPAWGWGYLLRDN